MSSLSYRLVAVSLALNACGAPATTAAVTAPTPTSVSSAPAMPAGPATRIPPTVMTEPPKNWQLLDETADHVPGISLERATSELLKSKTPKQTVLVAIIDNGIDTMHVDLKEHLWTNPKDGTHGWNFIGGKDGKDVNFDTFEVTRQYARCHNKAAASGAPAITDAAQCKEIDDAYAKQRTSIERTADNYRQVNNMLRQIVPALARVAGVPPESLTTDRVRAISPSQPQLVQARGMFLDLAQQGATPSAIEDGLKSLEGQVQYSLNADYNPRTIVGDNYANPNEHDYGNRDVMGPEAKHGTHVAGIIGAVRGNGIGIDGIASSVKFMMIRTVPDGDERDKDVANAIRFAADHGAQIISMSFGKAYSPYKAAVDDAVRYADSKGVLMVHAAGNDGADLAAGKNFPKPEYNDGGHPQNWIEVGASSWKGGDSLAAPFSNYAQKLVDVFAPGVDILSTVPGNQYERDSGTSMAAPVVSGLAALIMGYYPNLTAGDVKRIIMSSVTRVDQSVIRPGEDGPKVPFSSLSVTGGIVNAYNAIKMADDVSNGKARP
ncbi:MAG TPA: S8 family serine peptidase [Gemmatimonadaceae bacterium]|jgi:subtilisin family serine protease